MILLVEDSEDDVLFLRRAFKKAGVEAPLQVAYDGLEAVERLSAAPPSHVLLDLKLPKKSGLEILEWMRGRPDLASISVIILTSSREKSDVDRARALGIDDYCVKPVSFTELVALVRKIAEMWRLPLAQPAR
ncbi:MAG TPA: response regulator [Planctomycetota bacterium]